MTKTLVHTTPARTQTMEPEQKARVELPPSLTRQLIAYIGNKRRLLPFLAPIIAGSATTPKARPSRFVDLMSGSGAVSRLARHLGFEVRANDWETFAWVVTGAYLENSTEDLEDLFAETGGLKRVIDELNREGRRAAAAATADPDHGPAGYIASNFAPRRTEEPRIGRERLFYTAENARFIDCVRDEIERRFRPGGSSADERRRRVLIALLLYEASNHANTSGVFKAYHRGFGGLGRDALSRILSPMELEYPTAVNGVKGTASNDDALEFAKAQSGDVCYLDPPYNSHQYGSNYFLLNTIARWDRPVVDNSRDDSGVLNAKAGIRADWRQTRSPFCYRQSAAVAISELLDSVDCGTIIVSYSGSGVVGPEEMADLLSPHGALRLHGTGYAAYRGGRQSMNRSSVGREMAFVVSRGRPRNGRVQVTGQLQAWKVERLLAGRFVPARLSAQFPTRGSTVILGEGIEASTEHLYRFTDVHPEWISSAGMPRFVAGLEVALCRDHLEEFAVLLNLITAGDTGGVTRAQGIRYQRRLLTCLRKYAHRKYRDPFEKSVARLRNEIRASPGVFPIVEAGLEPIVEQAEARFRIASGADSL